MGVATAQGARVRPLSAARRGRRHGATAGTVCVRRRDGDADRCRSGRPGAHQRPEGTRTCAYDQARPGAVLQTLQSYVRLAVHGEETCPCLRCALLHCSCLGLCNSRIGGGTAGGRQIVSVSQRKHVHRWPGAQSVSGTNGERGRARWQAGA